MMSEERFAAALAQRYRIEGEIGRGGMATVYLAQDLRHSRQVALKVLDPHLTSGLGPERFLREIRTVAGLSHPHILPLHDSGEADGLLYYVMPYARGETLRARLLREGRLAVGDALQITREIAGALAYAHEHGVVHRDVKPANILLEAGHAMLADFGVARALAEATDDRITSTGISPGTPAYMSPEQAAGEPDLDGRSDQYSLACVVYEMLAGQPPFTGAGSRAVIGQHLAALPPSVTLARPEVPKTVAKAIAKALSKSPEDRYASMAEMVEDLGQPSVGMGRRPALSRVLALGVSLGLVAAATLVVLFAIQAASPTRPETPSYSVRQLTFSGTAEFPLVSPDGHLLAFQDKGNERLLDLRTRGDPITIAESGLFPIKTWSHDGAWLVAYGPHVPMPSGFLQWGTVKIPPISGGVMALQGTEGIMPTDLSSSGDSVHHLLFNGDSALVISTSLLGRAVHDTAAVYLGPTSSGRWRGRLAPEGERILIWQTGKPEALFLVRFDDSSVTKVFEGQGSSLRWRRDGRALFFFSDSGDHGRGIFTIPLDPESDRSISNNPRLLFPLTEGVLDVREGSLFSTWDISPDEETLYLERSSSSSHIWLARLDGDSLLDSRQLTFGTSLDDYPSVSPSGEDIVFWRRGSLFIVNRTGNGLRRVLDAVDQAPSRVRWSGDGRAIVFVRGNPNEVVIHDFRSGTTVSHRPEGEGILSHVDWDPGSGGLLALLTPQDGVGGGSLLRLELETGIWEDVIRELPEKSYRSLSVSPSGERVAVGWGQGGAESWSGGILVVRVQERDWRLIEDSRPGIDAWSGDIFHWRDEHTVVMYSLRSEGISLDVDAEGTEVVRVWRRRPRPRDDRCEGDPGRISLNDDWVVCSVTTTSTDIWEVKR
jgi:hypothetical protein